MPLTVNVGLNRKASKDFQSAGVSINLAAELDMGLLADPPRLQSEIDRIYAQAEEALELTTVPLLDVRKPTQNIRPFAAAVRVGSFCRRQPRTSGARLLIAGKPLRVRHQAFVLTL